MTSEAKTVRRKPRGLLRDWWFKAGLILIVPILLSVLISKLTTWNWTRGKPVAHPEIALYGPNANEVTDASGLQFSLPADYSVQSRTLPPSAETGEERVIVKCKRDWDGKPGGKLPAWLQISVKKESPDKPLADLAKKKKPDNGDPKQVGGVEEFQVDGNPAVRVRFEMRYHEHDFSREVVAVRKGEKVFFIRFECVKEDKSNVRDLMHDAISNARLLN